MDLSELALQKLLQLFPELSAYVVSFKDITDEMGKDESGIRVGMFLVQFGAEYYYIPIIAKDDTIFPIDSLFSVTESSFYPLTKVFVDRALNSSQVNMGKATKVPPGVIKNPSLYTLVTPPRTGKFVYASSSRMVEFLHTLPNAIKKQAMEKFASDVEIYNTLHQLFGLDNVMKALQPVQPPVRVVQKPAVELITGGAGLTHDEVQMILDKGYALRGENNTERVAVLANDFDKIGKIRSIRAIDGGHDYEIVTCSGQLKSAFVPKRAVSSPKFVALLNAHRDRDHGSQDVLAIFDNGDYAVCPDLVASGEPSDGNMALKSAFSLSPPITPAMVQSMQSVALFSPELTLIGAYNISGVYLEQTGVCMRGYSLDNSTTKPVCINAFRNCQTIDASNPNNIFIPANALMFVLGNDITQTLESSPECALRKLEMTTLEALGSAIDMGFDGIEFTINGKPVGPEVNVVQTLVIDEGIDPNQADTFIKQAKERRHVKIYMSKKADFDPGEIPQYGQTPYEQVETFGAGIPTQFQGNVNAAAQTQDPQVLESMVISELIQAGNMNELVREYLPDISQAVDRLGRTLLLARLNMDQLNTSQNASEVTTFIANLRNVYRLLGDNCIKLENMVSGPEQVGEAAGDASGADRD